MNITEYLLTDAHAKWADKMGFDGACNYTSMAFQKVPKKNSELNISFTIPTFNQFFDWVEEKWGLVVSGLRKSAEGLYEWELLVANKMNLPYFSFDEITSGFNIPSKRSARIAACEAIIKYVEENKL